ncbi:MAG: helix-turn-helix transcriptional regulator [Clostridia bacterium]|nr:helix-turn-helix transcriptional regulator [Clostridia bacterium]
MSIQYVATELTRSFRLAQVVSIHYFEYSADFHYPGESHDFWELIFCDKGKLKITVDQYDLFLSCGEAFLHRPGQFHNVHVCNRQAANSVIVSFYSDSKELYAVSDSIIKADTYVTDALFSILREAKSCFCNPQGLVYDAQLIRKEQSDLFASEQVIQNYLELLFIHLIRQSKLRDSFPQLPTQRKEDPLVQEITAYMREHLTEKLSFSVLTAHFSVSPTTLKALFRRNFGMGTMEYLMNLRIDRAKELLRGGHTSCTEIASLCGFCSVHHFSAAFKRNCGMSPLAYTKSVRSMLEYPESDR